MTGDRDTDADRAAGVTADARVSDAGTPATAPATRAAGTTRPIPADALIILPLRNMVMFPGTVFPLAIGRPQSQAAVQEAMRLERPLGVLLQSKPVKTSVCAANAAQNTPVPPTRFRKNATRNRASTTP